MCGVSAETVSVFRSLALTCKETNKGSNEFLRGFVARVLHGGGSTPAELRDVLRNAVIFQNAFSHRPLVMKEFDLHDPCDVLSASPAASSLDAGELRTIDWRDRMDAFLLLTRIAREGERREEFLLSRLGVSFEFGAGVKITALFCETHHFLVRSTETSEGLVVFANIHDSEKKFKTKRRLTRRMASVYADTPFKHALEACQAGGIACTETTVEVRPELAAASLSGGVTATLVLNVTRSQDNIKYKYYETDELRLVPLCKLRSSLRRRAPDEDAVFGAHAMHIGFHGEDGIYQTNHQDGIIDDLMTLKTCRERMLPLVMPLITLIVDATPGAKRARVTAIECTAARNRMARDRLIYENVMNVCTSVGKIIQ